jgi:hypothetical protein
MFATVGRFQFRELDDDVLRQLNEDVPRLVEGCSGFRHLYTVRPSQNELMMLWVWDSAADWEAAQPKFGPALQEYVVPNLAGPPERVGGDILLDIGG